MQQARCCVRAADTPQETPEELSAITVGPLLGRGAHGAVYRGLWQAQGDLCKVAVKVGARAAWRLGGLRAADPLRASFSEFACSCMPFGAVLAYRSVFCLPSCETAGPLGMMEGQRCFPRDIPRCWQLCAFCASSRRPFSPWVRRDRYLRRRFVASAHSPPALALPPPCLAPPQIIDCFVEADPLTMQPKNNPQPVLEAMLRCAAASIVSMEQARR